MFEKEAEEYRKDLKSKFFLSEPQLDLACQGFKDGYKKANEWHFVDREGLPEDKYKVFVQYVNGDYDIAFKFAGTWRGTSGNELRGVYAWKEIVPPSEPMRSLDKEEQKNYTEAINKVYKPTGVKLFDKESE